MLTHNTQPRITIHIPFSGFYESIHSDAIDRAVENLVSDDDGEPMQPHLDTLQGIIPWNLVRIEYAKAYVSRLDGFLPPSVAPLLFEELDSPREYNFTTDRIFCTIPQEFLHTVLMEQVNNHPTGDIAVAFDDVCREWFTSRSGFSSFYDPAWREWCDQRDVLQAWDTNQWSALFAAWCRVTLDSEGSMEELEEHIADYMQSNGVVERCVFDAVKAHDVLYGGDQTPPTRSAQLNAILDAIYEERRMSAGRGQLPLI